MSLWWPQVKITTLAVRATIRWWQRGMSRTEAHLHLKIHTKLGLSGEPLERKRLKRKIGSDDTAWMTPFQGVI